MPQAPCYDRSHLTFPDLWLCKEQAPPLQPITAYAEPPTIVTAVTSFDMPGMVGMPGVISESALADRIPVIGRKGLAMVEKSRVPLTPSGNPKVMKRQSRDTEKAKARA
eukprot:Skav236220  [mRNA]  locus=scaffold98:463089:464640:- [translate_table: standard]